MGEENIKPTQCQVNSIANLEHAARTVVDSFLNKTNLGINETGEDNLKKILTELSLYILTNPLINEEANQEVENELKKKEVENYNEFNGNHHISKQQCTNQTKDVNDKQPNEYNCNKCEGKTHMTEYSFIKPRNRLGRSIRSNDFKRRSRSYNFQKTVKPTPWNRREINKCVDKTQTIDKSIIKPRYRPGWIKRNQKVNDITKRKRYTSFVIKIKIIQVKHVCTLIDKGRQYHSLKEKNFEKKEDQPYQTTKEMFRMNKILNIEKVELKIGTNGSQKD